MKAFKVFVKPFEAPQFNLIFILVEFSEMHGLGRLKTHLQFKTSHIISVIIINTINNTHVSKMLL